MRVEQRQLTEEQITNQPQLRERQQELYAKYWSNDLVIYDDEGNILHITSKDNPNLGKLLKKYGLESYFWRKRR